MPMQTVRIGSPRQAPCRLTSISFKRLTLARSPFVCYDQGKAKATCISVRCARGRTQGVVNVYDPVVSSTPILTVLNTNSVSVVLNDYPIVVEALSASALTPANAPAKSAPEAAEKSQ
jgi:hypothetical protein